MAEGASVNCGTSRNWYWEAGIAEVRFQIIVESLPILCRVSEGWIEENLGAFESTEESLNAAKKAYDLICDEFRLRLSQDQREADGSLLLKGIATGD